MIGYSRTPTVGVPENECTLSIEGAFRMKNMSDSSRILEKQAFQWGARAGGWVHHGFRNRKTVTNA